MQIEYKLPPLVFQEWMYRLPMQQQSVLVLACRGPDGIGKFHPSKFVVVRYRACVLKAAYLGRAMHVDEGDETTFMSLRGFTNDTLWGAQVKKFFEHIDELPHHYTMHLMHGAQIIGYKHPHPVIANRWRKFYVDCCHDLHVNPETELDMDERLNDWNREHWD